MADKTIWEAASRALKNSKVVARIEEIRHIRGLTNAKLAERYEITQDRIAAELARLGFSNMLDYMRVGPDGDPVLDFSAIDRDQAAALTEVTVESFVDGSNDEPRPVRRVKFKLADKRAALVDLGKHLGMFQEKKAVLGPMQGLQPLAPGQSRVVIERQVLEVFTSTPEVSGGEVIEQS